MSRRLLHSALPFLATALLACPAWAEPPARPAGEKPIIGAAREVILLPELDLKASAPTLPVLQEEEAVETLVRSLDDRFDLPGELRILPGATREMGLDDRERIWRRLQQSSYSDHSEWHPYLPHRQEVFDFVLRRSRAWGAPRSWVPDWVLLNDPRFQSQRGALAEKGRAVALRGLAADNWAAAEPLVRRHLGGPTRVTALSLLLQHGQEVDSSSAGLLAALGEKGCSKDDQERALYALLRYPWPGRTDFLEEALQQEPSEAFKQGVAGDPDFSVPILNAALNSEATGTRWHATQCLLRIRRAEALEPLLGWLGDPNWKGLPSPGRQQYLESLAATTLEQAAPALLEIVRTGEEPEALRAVRALVRLRPVGFDAAFLRRLAAEEALGGPSFWATDTKSGWVAAGLEAELFSQKERLGALEWLAEQFAAGRDRWNLQGQAYGREQALAWHQIRHGPDARTLRALTELIEVLRKANDPRASHLERLLPLLFDNIIDESMLDRLAHEDCDQAMLITLLGRRDLLWDNQAALQAVLRGRGAPRGVALVLVGDRQGAERCLEQGDVSASQTLLATARYLDFALDADLVARAASRGSALTPFAVAYLDEREDEHARAMSQALDSTPRIVGRSKPGTDFGTFEVAAGKMLEEDPEVDEVFGLATQRGTYQELRWFVVLRSETASMLEWTRGGKVRSRPLGREAVRLFRERLAGKEKLPWFLPHRTFFAHVPPPIEVVEYLRLTHQGGRRVVLLPDQSQRGWFGKRSPEHDQIYEAFQAVVPLPDEF